MQYTLVAPVADVATLDTVWESVPAAPRPEADCCGRIVDDTATADRATAREWLVFLQALGCVSVDAGDYYRVHRPSGQETVGKRFQGRVFAVPDILEALESASGSLSPEAVAERLDEGLLSRIERQTEAHEYIRRVLGWAVEFGLASRDGDRFRR